jgi:hypothetical protein
MKYSIFAHRGVSSSKSSEELRRFETPEDANAEALAVAYANELQRQGWQITDAYPVDSDGYPVANGVKKSSKKSAK